MASEGVWFSIGPFGKEKLKSIRSQLSRASRDCEADAAVHFDKEPWITLVAVADGAVL